MSVRKKVVNTIKFLLTVIIVLCAIVAYFGLKQIGEDIWSPFLNSSLSAHGIAIKADEFIGLVIDFFLPLSFLGTFIAALSKETWREGFQNFYRQLTVPQLLCLAIVLPLGVHAENSILAKYYKDHPQS